MRTHTFTKLFFLCLLILTGSIAKSQNANQKWALGLHGALIEANTSLGSDFFSFKINSDNTGAALSLHRYLSPSFNAGIQFLNGATYQTKEPFHFYDNASFTELFLHYKLNNGKILKEDVRVGPYLAAGGGLAVASINAFGETEGQLNDSKSQADFFAGIGFRIRLTSSLSLDWQSAFHFPGDNTWDANENGSSDQFLIHTLGVVLGIGAQKDSDGDGVSDNTDMCPDTPHEIAVDEKGCPVDSDHDGIADYQDECPLLAGISSLHGCPDKDGDGLADKKDRCPELAGPIAFQGCPDTDLDSVPDIDDQCPGTKPGYKVDEKGCPKDSDGDGVVDNEDDCPTVKGLVTFKGCPDTDGDGTVDQKDKCPTVPGIIANSGCPELPKEVVSNITRIASKILFETGKDVLQQKSKSQLNELSDIMKKFADTKLSIEGHTDNTGQPDLNLKLSQDRCETVKNYLVSKGISAERLRTIGYGETKPIADNATEKGRAQNRRVELKTEY